MRRLRTASFTPLVNVLTFTEPRVKEVEPVGRNSVSVFRLFPFADRRARKSKA
jgi:hypothetical protein